MVNAFSPALGHKLRAIPTGTESPPLHHHHNRLPEIREAAEAALDKACDSPPLAGAIL